MIDSGRPRTCARRTGRARVAPTAPLLGRHYRYDRHTQIHSWAGATHSQGAPRREAPQVTTAVADQEPQTLHCSTVHSPPGAQAGVELAQGQWRASETTCNALSIRPIRSSIALTAPRPCPCRVQRALFAVGDEECGAPAARPHTRVHSPPSTTTTTTTTTTSATRRDDGSASMCAFGCQRAMCTCAARAQALYLRRCW